MQKLMDEKQRGMRVSMDGLVGRIARGEKPDKGQRYMLGEMLKHLHQVANAFYDGSDETICDQFFQLYCLDDKRNLPAPGTTNEPTTGLTDSIGEGAGS